MKNQIFGLIPSKAFSLFFLFLFTNKTNAATYIFNGAFGSNWSSSWSWSTGMPPNPIPAGDNVVLTAACFINIPITCNGSISYTGNFPVSINSYLTIGAGGSFTIANLTNNGVLIINGAFVTNSSFTNNNAFEINSTVNIAHPVYNNGIVVINTSGNLTFYRTATTAGSLQNSANRGIVVNGRLNLNQTSLLNQGSLSVNAGAEVNCITGGTIQNNYIFQNSGNVIIGTGCSISNNGTISNFNNGTIAGNGIIYHYWLYNGYSGSKFSPGSSGTGTLSFAGNSSANILGNTTYLCNINGTNQGVDYDLLALGSFATLSAASLTVNWGSFIPPVGQSFTVLTCGTRIGQFAFVNIPPIPGRIFTVIYNPNSVVIYVTSVVPLHLLNFSGSIAQDNQVELNWNTEGEVNTAGYEIQESDDGINFLKAGFVPAKNTANTASYQFRMQQKSSKSHYRLKMIDRDGRFTYSNIILLTASPFVKQIRLYPNPAVEKIYLEMNREIKKTAIEITDASGKIILREQKNSSANQAINIAHLPAGIYQLKIFYHQILISTEKFIKL